MFLAVKGTYRIPELDITLRPGEIFGELGLLTSENRRTQSVECVESGHVLTITYDSVRELYFENPEFGFYFLRLTSNRLLREVARLEAQLEAERRKHWLRRGDILFRKSDIADEMFLAVKGTYRIRAATERSLGVSYQQLPPKNETSDCRNPA
jgi:CRP-like cAMP-binding protein